MKRISAVTCTALALATAPGPSTPLASEAARAPRPPAAWRELTLGVGLNMDSNVVSLEGFFCYGGVGKSPAPSLALVLRARMDAATEPDPEAARLRTVRIISTPNVGECVRRLTVAARVMQSVSRSAMRHWWGSYSGAEMDEGR